MNDAMILPTLDSFLAVARDMPIPERFLPTGALIGALVKSIKPSEISIESILRIRGLGIYNFKTLVSIFNSGLKENYDYSDLLMDIQYRFLDFKSKDQNTLCHFVVTSDLSISDHTDILDVFLQSKSVLVKRQLIRGLTLSDYSGYNDMVLNLLEEGIRDALYAAVLNFSSEDLLKNVDTILEYFKEDDLDFGDWLLRKCILRVSELDEIYAEIARHDWPTYTYICAKIWKDIDDEVCLKEYICYCEALNWETSDKAGLIIWSYGVLKKTQALTDIVKMNEAGFFSDLDEKYVASLRQRFAEPVEIK